MTEHSLHCPACTHDEFDALTDRNSERRVQCKGCDARFTLDELKRLPDDARHHIVEVDVNPVHGTPGEISFTLKFKYVDETHVMDCALNTHDGEIMVSHRDQLDSISWMDEEVMEDLATQFIKDTKAYLTR